jgi:hypothetical protein
MAGGAALCAHAGESLAFGTGFAQHDHGAKGFGVHTGDEVSLPRAFLFPELTNLNFRNGHGVNPDCRVTKEGCQLLSVALPGGEGRRGASAMLVDDKNGG